jgi:hypothetical protein
MRSASIRDRRTAGEHQEPSIISKKEYRDMAFDYEDAGTFGSEREAKDWAHRNKIDLRDLHIRRAGGDRVEVGIRKSAYDKKEDYNNQTGRRNDGFWR